MTAPRLRTDFWVSALRRRAEAAGAFISIARRGAEEAGAIFVQVDRRDGALRPLRSGAAEFLRRQRDRPAVLASRARGVRGSDPEAHRAGSQVRSRICGWSTSRTGKGVPLSRLSPDEFRCAVHLPLTIMLPDLRHRANTDATWLTSCHLQEAGRPRPRDRRSATGEVVIFPGVRVEYHDRPPTPPAKPRQRRAKRNSDALTA